jgi:hypothetical protein
VVDGLVREMVAVVDARRRDQRRYPKIASWMTASVNSRGLVKAIFLGGILAATVDIAAACLINGRSVPFILHTIAGGLLGRRSFSGGAPTAVLGFILQEGMGIIIAAIYVLASQRLTTLTRRWFPWGVLYGAGIFVAMNYVVLPLSAWRVIPSFSAWKLAANLAAMFLFGVIVAFVASRRR